MIDYLRGRKSVRKPQKMKKMMSTIQKRIKIVPSPLEVKLTHQEGEEVTTVRLLSGVDGGKVAVVATRGRLSSIVGTATTASTSASTTATSDVALSVLVVC